MHGNTVRRLRKTTTIGAMSAFSLTLGRFGVAPLVLASSVASLACSATENTQPRNMMASTGGVTGGTSATGGAVSTGGSLPNATGGNAATTGGQGTGGNTGGTLSTGGTGGTGTATAGQAGASAGSGGSAGAGGAKGGTGGGATGGSSGAGAGGKSSSGGSSATTGGGSSGGVAGSAGAAGGGGAATCPGFVFCDSFEDGNITANPVWLATAGAFTVVDDGSNVLKQQGSSEAWAYSGSGTWTDVTIQARVKVLDFMGTSSTNCAGLVARWQGSSSPNYQANLCAKGTVGIYKDGDLVDETNGTKTANIVANTWYTLKFKVSGQPGGVSLVLSIDDAPVITITDPDTSTPVTAGFVAVGSKKAFSIEYDDVKVSSP